MSEPSLQTSFIPKRNLRAAVNGAQSNGVFLIIALVIFLASAAVGGGIYVNKLRLVRTIEGPDGLAKSLVKAREAFDKELLESITRFDTRLRAGSSLLASHVTLVPLFMALNQYTLETVRFTSFDFSTAENGPQVRLRGEAKSFESIALQSESFVSSKFFKDVVFSNLNADNTGKVVFDLSMRVDQVLISYIESRRL